MTAAVRHLQPTERQSLVWDSARRSTLHVNRQQTNVTSDKQGTPGASVSSGDTVGARNTCSSGN